MSCCGQKRMALAQGRTAEPSPAVSASSTTSASMDRGRSEKGDVLLRYLGTGMFSARGNRTGRVYLCSGTGAQLSVDPRDAGGLLHTRLFART